MFPGGLGCSPSCLFLVFSLVFGTVLRPDPLSCFSNHSCRLRKSRCPWPAEWFALPCWHRCEVRQAMGVCASDFRTSRWALVIQLRLQWIGVLRRRCHHGCAARDASSINASAMGCCTSIGHADSQCLGGRIRGSALNAHLAMPSPHVLIAFVSHACPRCLRYN